MQNPHLSKNRCQYISQTQSSQTLLTHPLTQQIMASAQSFPAAIQDIIIQFANADGSITIPMEELIERLKPKAKTTKPKRDPNKPKHPKSAFLFWCDLTRAEMRHRLELANAAAALPGEEPSKVRAADVAKELGRVWKEIPDEHRQPFVAQARLARMEYADAIKAYREENGITEPTKEPRPDFDPSVVPDTPEGWTRSAQGGYLEEAPVDPETGKKITRCFHDFAEAVAIAERIGAGGITRTTKGFKIRKGRDFCFTMKSRAANELSWCAPIAEQVFSSAPQSPSN